MPTHRRAGRKLDRHSQERVALFRNMTMSLIERFGSKHEFILTSIAKAKEARGFAERIVTLSIKARRELDAAAKAAGVADGAELRKQHETDKKRFEGKNKDAGYGDKVREHVRKHLHYRRLIIQRLGSTTIPTHRASEFDGKAARHERAVEVLIDQIAMRFIKRTEENPKAQGGYTRVLKTAQWVKGDGSTKALWGWVGGLEANQAPSPTAAAATTAPAGAR